MEHHAAFSRVCISTAHTSELTVQRMLCLEGKLSILGEACALCTCSTEPITRTLWAFKHPKFKSRTKEEQETKLHVLHSNGLTCILYMTSSDLEKTLLSAIQMHKGYLVSLKK